MLRSTKNTRAENVLLFIFFSVTVIIRIPFTSKLLYHWDSVQFALALEKYDITVHQPHPPGYFLYVMLGRVINQFLHDANITFVSISIFFSGLAVVTIYYLSKELFDNKTGIFAALIALTSPNLWFHGEVALTYVVEAFFSSLIALLCWRILKGEHRYLWLSVIALGIAGGIRQNTIVFLLPLWLFSVKTIPLRRIFLSLCLLGVVCLFWFIPMVWMTGGWTAYNEALKELWEFNTGHVSVFETGGATFPTFSAALVRFVIYGLGAGILILGLTLYSLIRHKKLRYLDREKSIFFFLWIMPAVLFYLLIFIHPANPGYALIFIPALLILTASSVGLFGHNMKLVLKKDLSPLIVSSVLIINTAMFFLYDTATYKEIKTHDRDLTVMLDGIKSFSPNNTAIFVEPYIFYGFRHIMYYLPDYRTYLVDVRITPSGERRKTFWGIHRETFLSNDIYIPTNVAAFIIPTLTDIRDRAVKIEGSSIKQLSSGMFIASGPLALVQEIFPELILISE